VVQWQSRRGGEFLHRDFQKLQDREPDALWRSGPGTKGTVMAVIFELAGREFTGTGDKEIQEIENPRKVPRIETARQSHKRALPNL
jgi:hypothetical protein